MKYCIVQSDDCKMSMYGIASIEYVIRMYDAMCDDCTRLVQCAMYNNEKYMNVFQDYDRRCYHVSNTRGTRHSVTYGDDSHMVVPCEKCMQKCYIYRLSMMREKQLGYTDTITDEHGVILYVKNATRCEQIFDMVNSSDYIVRKRDYVPNEL